MKREHIANCAHCDIPSDERVCIHQIGKGYKGCPTLLKPDLIEETRTEYAKQEIAEFARQASIQEAECYANRGQKPFCNTSLPNLGFRRSMNLPARWGIRVWGLRFVPG